MQPGLADLGERDEHIGMVDAEGVGVQGDIFKRGDKGVGEAVGDLQTHAQEHREAEENGHLLLFEQGEGAQSERVGDRLLLAALDHGAMGQREGVEEEEEADRGGGHKLVLVGLEPQHIDQPHRTDETDGAEDADGREMLDGVHPGLCQSVVGHGVAQGERGHVEGYGEGVDREEEVVEPLLPRIGGGEHQQTGQQVAVSQQALSGYPAVSDDTHQGGHEYGDDSLNGIEPTDLRGHADRDQIRAHRRKIGAPCSELKEVHCGQTNF